MPTIGEMTSGLADIEVTFHALVVKAQYYPAKITERTIQQIQAFSRPSGDMSGFTDLNAMVVDLVASWDLMENDGTTMFPIDTERLPELPVMFRVNLLASALKDMRPNA